MKFTEYIAKTPKNRLFLQCIFAVDRNGTGLMNTNSDDIFEALGVTYINPGDYDKLNHEERMCLSLAQIESLSVSIRVYRADKTVMNSAIKGCIATVGRDSAVQEVDRNFTPDTDIPHMVIHKKCNLNREVKPGDDVVIRYQDGIGRVIPVRQNALYAYDIDFDGDEVTLERITRFISEASNGGVIKLSPEKIAEVVGNAVTNVGSCLTMSLFGMKKPDSIIVDITDHILTLDMQHESIIVSEKLLKAHQFGYRADLQNEIKPQIVFNGPSANRYKM
jgi:hypothetical protein